MKRALSLTFILFLSLMGSLTSEAAPLKPRIVVLTDISPITAEPDDFESTIRLLVHADLFEIEGLVATTGWSNRGGSERPDLLTDIINAYEKDLPNLLKLSNQKGHLSDESKQQIGYWPSPGYLRSRTVLGSQKMGMRFIGKENNSPGSDLIIKLADEADERPIWVLAWGGGNTVAPVHLASATNAKPGGVEGLPAQTARLRNHGSGRGSKARKRDRLERKLAPVDAPRISKRSFLHLG